VGDVRNAGPEQSVRPEIMLSLGGNRTTSYPLMIRVTGDPGGAAAPVEAALRAVDPALAVSRVRPMAEVIGRSVGRARFISTLLLVFAAVAMVLTVAGLYGIMSYSVVQRTREIGIRTALGSSARQTVRMVLRQGMVLVILGLAVGLAGGVGLTRLLTTFLYGVSPFDLITWVVGCVALTGVAMAALWLPARRAARVDPLEAIRAE
jgi:ABC-type antimicrobial peptide transport system permease subunit